jgi:hypothetical protein
MAIIEIQFREDKFFNILRAQMARVDIPRAFFPELGPDRLIERIEPGQVSFADQADPAFAGQREGEVIFKIPFLMHHTSFTDARAAGSLMRPATQQIACVFWIKIGGAAPATLVWSLVGATVSGQFRPVLPMGDSFSLGSVGLTVSDLLVVAGAGVVALRLGTRTNDALLGAGVNRLGGADWGYFIAGEVFADQLAETMNEAVSSAAQGSSDPELEVDSLGAGIWSDTIPLVPGLVYLPVSWGAFAEVGIVALGAIPVIHADVPVRIVASTQITPNVGLQQLVLSTTINWFAHDFITQGSAGLITVVEDKVSTAMLSKLKSPPGQTVTDHGDKYIVYRSVMDLLHPKTSLFTTSVQQAGIGEDGFWATGALTVFQAPVASFTLDAPRWVSGEDCHSRSWKTEFHPPAVHIFCRDRFFGLKLRSAPVIDPPGFWIPTIGSTGVGTGIEVRDIVFRSPSPVPPPAGATSSAFLNTNLGVRWVDFGAVPAQPVPSNNPTGLEARVISDCMAISDRWGMGVFNLAWLIDPPDSQFELAPLRDWTIVAEGIVDLDRIELVAIGPNGERRLPSISVEEGTVFAQVVTDADETLHVRSKVSMLSAPPQVLQRWIVPWSAIPVEPGITPLALLDGVLWVTDGGKLSRIELPGIVSMESAADTSMKIRRVHTADLPLRLADHLKRRGERVLPRPQIVGQGRIVAVLHRGDIVLGLAGPRIPVTQAIRSEHNGQQHKTKSLKST